MMNIFIDLILKSIDFVFFYLGVINIDNILSDYKVIYIFLKMGIIKSKCYIRKVWDYKNVDIIRFNIIIENIDWDLIISNVFFIEKVIEFFIDKYLEFVRECIFEKLVMIRFKDKFWFDFDLCIIFRKKNRF